MRAKARNSQERERKREVELLVDIGAIYSVVPGKILEGLRIGHRSLRKIKLADGRVIERCLGVVEVEVKGKAAHSTAVFGKDDDAAVLGGRQWFQARAFRETHGHWHQRGR